MAITRRDFCQNGIAACALSAAELRSGAAATSLPASLDRLRKGAPLLDADAQVRRWSFWTNPDWAWYRTNLPMWESPNAEIDEMYYFRAEILTKHLRYCSPETGYIFTEFSGAETLPWAGRYNGISGAADLHLEEVRWLKTKRYAADYVRYWMETPGAKPRDYGFAPAWAAWQVAEVQGNFSLALRLLPHFVDNFGLCERGVVRYPEDNGYDPERQLFWQTGRDVGGEFNLASCQLSETLRGIPGYKIRGGAGYRPDINAIQFAEAQTIARLARMAGDEATTARFDAKADLLRRTTMRDLWDEERQFFLHRWRYDEYSEGDMAGHRSIRAWSKIWETNSDRMGGVGYQPQRRGAGHGRELTGYVPWRYGLVEDDARFAAAWAFLKSNEHFQSAYGPTTAEQGDPWFHVAWDECRHNGQSWPYHTSRILNAAARLLCEYRNHGGFNKDDYFAMLEGYARTQRKDGRPHLAEAHDPFRDVWVRDKWPGLDYFHSSYLDLIITGLAGLRPGPDEQTVVVQPLAPERWDFFALDRVAYRDHVMSIVWDRTGTRYGVGAGLTVLVDGSVAVRSGTLERVAVSLQPVEAQRSPYEVIVSANAEGKPFPKPSASNTAQFDSAAAALDGILWCNPNNGTKWSCRDSWTEEDWFQVEFADETEIAKVKLYFFVDGQGLALPDTYEIRTEQQGVWQVIQDTQRLPTTPSLEGCNTVSFAPRRTRKVRIIFHHPPGVGVGLSQLQVIAAAQ